MPTDKPLRLDHIVIAVGDLNQSMVDYQGLGFTVLPGGQHAGRTSHNALVVLADGAYLELKAWRAPAENERWYRVLAAHGDGLVDFALLSHDTVAMLAQARARGLASLTGPLDGQRVRPDGVQLLWQTARHTTPDLPFLCGDVTPRALRVPEGDARIHANGARGVQRIVVAVADMAATLARYQALLGHAAPGFGSMHIAADTGLQQIEVYLDGTTVVLTALATAEPVPRESAAAQALRQRLATRGEGPCAIVLHGTAGHPDLTADSATLHGVALKIVPAEA